jgi:hypothetical protein
MKIKIMLFYFLIIFIYANKLVNPPDSSISTQNRDKEWKGNISFSGNIKIINNPSVPLYGEVLLQLKEELAIGNENDENSAFYKGTSLAIDKDENIYIFDFGNCKLQIYDKSGHYVRTVGRKGQGPGEFEFASDPYIDDSTNNIFIASRIKPAISVFNPSGIFIKTIPLKFRIYPIAIFPNEYIFGWTSSTNPKNVIHTVMLFDINKNEKKDIENFVIPNPQIQLKGGFLGYFNAFLPRFFSARLNNDLIVYGCSSNYKISVVNKSGDIIKYILKNDKPLSYTKKDKEDIINEEYKSLKEQGISAGKDEIENVYSFPSIKAFYYRLYSDGNGNLFVLKSDMHQKDFSFDLFNEEGYYLFKIFIKNEPDLFPPSFIFRNGYIYSTAIDRDSGYEKVKKFKIMNWDDIINKINRTVTQKIADCAQSRTNEQAINLNRITGLN